jgi:hypothetical protein
MAAEALSDEKRAYVFLEKSWTVLLRQEWKSSNRQRKDTPSHYVRIVS